jgi:hypothetical protein
MSHLVLMAVLTFMFGNPSQPDDRWHFGSYVLERSAHTGRGSGYRILKNDSEVHAAGPAGFRIISVANGKEIDMVEPTASDITGDGIPDLIIEEFPRTPGCCFNYSILSLGPKFKEVAYLTGFPSTMIFEDINRDSIYEITGEDWTFVSNYASPRIILAYRNGGYRLAMNLMKRTPPSRVALEAEAKKLAVGSPVAGLPIPLEAYARVVNMIYEGNAHSALRLLDWVWPDSNPGIEEFKKTFLSDLEKSPYWAEIRSVNGNAFDGFPR